MHQHSTSFSVGGLLLVLTITCAPHARAQQDTAARAERSVAGATAPPEGATGLRLQLAEPPDAAFARVVRVLDAAGYRVARAETDSAVTTRFRYVRGAGLVQVSAVVLPDGAGAVLVLAGASRRLRRLGLVSAAGPIERVTYVPREHRRRVAWQQLADLAEALAPRRLTYEPSQ